MRGIQRVDAKAFTPPSARKGFVCVAIPDDVEAQDFCVALRNRCDDMGGEWRVGVL